MSLRPNRAGVITDLELTSLTRIEQGEISHLGSHQLRPGAGPRHLEFNKHTTVLYICGELDNTVTVLHYNTDLVDRVMAGNYKGDLASQERGLLRHLQTVSTVPADLTSKSTIAEMRLHPSGRLGNIFNIEL